MSTDPIIQAQCIGSVDILYDMSTDPIIQAQCIGLSGSLDVCLNVIADLSNMNCYINSHKLVIPEPLPTYYIMVKTNINKYINYDNCGNLFQLTASGEVPGYWSDFSGGSIKVLANYLNLSDAETNLSQTASTHGGHGFAYGSAYLANDSSNNNLANVVLDVSVQIHQCSTNKPPNSEWISFSHHNGWI